MAMSPNYFVVQKKGQCLACFMDYEVMASGHNTDLRNDGMICQCIKLGRDRYLIIKAKQELVEAIHREINKSVLQLIPYGMALRVFLIERGIELVNTIVFVDYQDSCVYLTIIDQEFFSAPRVIPNADPALIQHEIERTIRHFELSNDQKEGAVKVISNRELGVDHPVNDGLLVGNYDVNFDLPERIIAHKKRAFYSALMTAGFALVTSLVIAFALYLTVVNQQVQLDQYVKQLTNEASQLRNEVASLRSKRIPLLIKSSPQLPVEALYHYATSAQGFALVIDSWTGELVNGQDWLITIRYLVNRQFTEKEYPHISQDQEIHFKNSQQGLMMEVQFKYESIIS